jgi:hypothetical protein
VRKQSVTPDYVSKPSADEILPNEFVEVHEEEQ